MNLPRKIVETVDVKTVEVHVKVCDSGFYTLKQSDGRQVAQLDGEYVPRFFPGDHHGDYLILDIDLETGRIENWKRPEPIEVARAFNFIAEEE